MTTPGNGGADSTQGTPAEDDVFGYLYADGQAAGATPPPGGGGYGYPGSRSSYGQVRTVGERQYGQPQQTAGQPSHGQMPPHAPQQQSSAYYAAPETLPGGPGQPGRPPASRAQNRRGSGGGRGPNTKGLLIGALAVVAAVVAGIGIAVATGGNDEPENAGGDPAPSVTQEQPPGDAVKQGGDGKNQDKPAPAPLPKEDAKALTLAGGTTVAGDIKGAKAAGGTYVAGLNQVGASATWAVNDVPKDGQYRLYVTYGVPGKKASTTLTVNGEPQTRKLNMDNFAHASEGAWDKGWTRTYAQVQLKKGSNTLMISCEQGDTCDANLDQVWLEKG
ncbi:carbohydrate-binding protein [Streptomyces sp. NPDC060194]|uniref:carbohydrate-binding protein n=1 Tax=Streptomyces sp. NPDC060194 TaxID=3347069 RepID=UPI003662D940